MTTVTAKPVSEAATVRVGSAQAIPAVLRTLGFDPAAVFAEAGIDLALLDNADNRIAFSARGHLLRQCVAQTGCAHFGLLVGEQGDLAALGLPGLLAKYSADVGAALRNLVRTFHLHARGAVVSLTVDGDAAMLGYEVYQARVEATDQIGDGAVAFMLKIMRSLCGPDWAPAEALFAHRRPVDVGPFRRFIRAPLRFDAEHYALVFSTDWLAHRLPTDDPTLRRLLQQQIDALEARHGDDLPEQVRSVLRTALMTRHGSADQVAALLSMHSRTLNRRLRAFDTNFQALVDEGRFEIARQMLEDSALDVSQIALALDYADASAFTRAFRRWSGTTPARWRLERVPLG